MDSEVNATREAAIAALREAVRLADKSDKIDRVRVVGRSALAHLPTILDALAQPSAADCVDFNSWWSASKYTQVVYAPEWTQQIARDGWDAALAAR